MIGYFSPLCKFDTFSAKFNHKVLQFNTLKSIYLKDLKLFFVFETC